MSEEEIINKAEEIIIKIRTGREVSINDDTTIQGLLDLYNKEKEKNKKWEDKIKEKIKEYEATGYEEAAGALQELLEEKEI